MYPLNCVLSLSFSSSTRTDLSYWHREFSEQYVKLGSIPIIRSFIIASVLSVFETASSSSSSFSSSSSSSHPEIKWRLRIVEFVGAARPRSRDEAGGENFRPSAH